MWRGGLLLRMLAAFQQVERTVETAQRRGQIGAVLGVEAFAFIDVVQQLERVPDMLTGGLVRPRAALAVAPVEGAAPLGALPQVHHPATILEDACQEHAARHRTAIDAAATVGKQATDRKHALISHYRGAGATRRAVT